MNIKDKFDSSWIDVIGLNILTELLTDVAGVLRGERLNCQILPEVGSDVTFKAFKLTPYNKVKVIVLGQDIYHTPGVFNGIAFGNGFPDERAEKIQPSLRNILKEVKRTHAVNSDPSLYHWAKQGVLLINTAHTVMKGEAGSHLSIWEDFTATVLNTLNNKNDIVWMLWGRYAHDYDYVVTNPTHKIIKTGHPSPLNRTNPFVGSDCFKQCDELLGDKKIIW